MATPLTLRGVKGLRLTEAEGDNNFKAATIQIADVATLKTLEGDFDGQQVNLAGYYSDGDGGGQMVYWNAASTETPNDGTIFQATGVATGRWKSVDTSEVTGKQFGAKGDGVTEDTTFLQAALTYAVDNTVPLHLTSGSYVIGSGLVATDAAVIYGDGLNETELLCSLGFGYIAITFQKPISGVSKGASVLNMVINGVSKSVTRKAIYLDSNQIMAKIDTVRFLDLRNGIEIHSDGINGQSYGHQITNCRFNGILELGIEAYGNSEQLWIEHCWFQAGNNAPGNAAIHITSSTSTQIKGCIFQVFYDAIVINGGKPVAIKDCHFEDQNNYNITLNNSTSFWNDDITISGCYMRAGKRGIYMTSNGTLNGQGLTLLNNTFTEITDTGLSGGTTQSPVYATSATVYTNIVMINNNWHRDFSTSVAISDGFNPDLEITSELTELLIGRGIISRSPASSTNPVWSFEGDSDTGLGSSAANTVSLIAGGAETISGDTTATAGNVRMSVYDVDNGAMERVSVGIADSGGVGFKVLRIPN